MSTSELTSPWNTRWYDIGGPLGVNPVRSAWELPRDAVVPAGRTTVLTGRSWSGAAPPEPGRHELLARATDLHGRTQPDVAAFNPNGYFFDAVVRHPVTVA